MGRVPDCAPKKLLYHTVRKRCVLPLRFWGYAAYMVTPQTVKKVGLFFTNIRSQVEKQFKNQKLRSVV